MPRGGKHATNTKRRKTRNQYHEKEDMLLTLRVGRHATSAREGKTCNQCEEQEDKYYYYTQAWEDMQTMPRPGRRNTGVKHAKTITHEEF